jgi:hypothetical protein
MCTIQHHIMAMCVGKLGPKHSNSDWHGAISVQNRVMEILKHNHWLVVVQHN